MWIQFSIETYKEHDIQSNKQEPEDATATHVYKRRGANFKQQYL